MVKYRTLNLECLHWFETHLLLVSEFGHFRSLHDALYFSFEVHFQFKCGQWFRLLFVSLIIIVSVDIIKSMRTSKHTYTIVVARLPGRTRTSSLCKVKQCEIFV